MQPSFSMRFYFLRGSNFVIIFVYKDYFFFLHVWSLELHRPRLPLPCLIPLHVDT